MFNNLVSPLDSNGALSVGNDRVPAESLIRV
jgi:hypothetical protein